MARASIILTALLISFALSTMVHAGEVAAQSSLERWDAASLEDDVKGMIKEYKSKAVANMAFMEAAKRIVKVDEKAEALTHLNMATVAAEESRRHYDAGEYSIALEDLFESTRMANYAIIHANSDNPSIRELVIEEQLILNAEREHKRKEAMITRGFLEAETFINTAERLLLSDENAEARRGVDAAKGLFESAEKFLAMEEYDAALADINEAYRLSTGAVREIKRDTAGAMTFPKPKAGNQEEVFVHERRRNDTNLFFAGQVIEGSDKEAWAMLKEARKLRSAATMAMKSGDPAKAIEKVKASNELLITLIKGEDDD